VARNLQASAASDRENWRSASCSHEQRHIGRRQWTHGFYEYQEGVKRSVAVGALHSLNSLNAFRFGQHACGNKPVTFLPFLYSVTPVTTYFRCPDTPGPCPRPAHSDVRHVFVHCGLARAAATLPRRSLIRPVAAVTDAIVHEAGRDAAAVAAREPRALQHQHETLAPCYQNFVSHEAGGILLPPTAGESHALWRRKEPHSTAANE